MGYTNNIVSTLEIRKIKKDYRVKRRLHRRLRILLQRKKESAAGNIQWWYQLCLKY